MAISEKMRQELYQRSGGRCECKMTVCSHHRAGVRCSNLLKAGWDAHHKTAGGLDTLSNLIAMCLECHKNTRTYGKH